MFFIPTSLDDLKHIIIEIVYQNKRLTVKMT